MTVFFAYRLPVLSLFPPLNLAWIWYWNLSLAHRYFSTVPLVIDLVPFFSFLLMRTVMAFLDLFSSLWGVAGITLIHLSIFLQILHPSFRFTQYLQAPQLRHAIIITLAEHSCFSRLHSCFRSLLSLPPEVRCDLGGGNAVSTPLGAFCLPRGVPRHCALRFTSCHSSLKAVSFLQSLFHHYGNDFGCKIGL